MIPVTPSLQVLRDALRWEGKRLVVYADSLGFLTQGIGRHTGVKLSDPMIDDDTALRWFAEDWDTAYRGSLLMFPAELDQIRRDALAWLVFNMGTGKLAEFAPFVGHVNKQRWSSAAYHLETNLHGHLTPYLIQVGARGAETALRIATGEILEEFQV